MAGESSPILAGAVAERYLPVGNTAFNEAVISINDFLARHDGLLRCRMTCVEMERVVGTGDSRRCRQLAAQSLSSLHDHAFAGRLVGVHEANAVVLL
jgi:hypothetical protein